MKLFLISISSFLLCCNVGFSQGDSTGNDPYLDSVIQYMDPLDYAFMMHEPTRWMFKIQLPSPVNYELVGFEQKITKDISLGLAGGFKGSRWFLAGQSRWYYKMKKEMENKRREENMSGAYLALSGEYPIGLPWALVSARWGIQNRFLKRTYLDIGFSLNKWVGFPGHIFGIKSHTNIGLALTKDKYALSQDKLCPVLKCYEAEKRIFKINSSNLLDINIGNVSQYFQFNPEIGFEQKIKETPFSINTNLRGVFIGYSHNDHFDNFFGYQLDIESRWYYNLKKRILKGKTGNGMSADYFALGITNYGGSGDDHIFLGSYNRVAPTISWGIQRTIAEHLYYNFSINVAVEKNFLDQFDDSFQPHYRNAISAGIGYRF